MDPVRAQVIVLAGPSGSGKSRLAERVGLPVLRLDDFYKNGGDATLPRDPRRARTPASSTGTTRTPGCPTTPSRRWPRCAATAGPRCRSTTSRTTAAPGTHTLDLRGGGLFVAEGIFAQEIVGACRDAGLLAAAYCVRQHPAVTFWRRLTRDLREHRKPPLVLVRRGLALLRDQRRVVEHAVALGCEPVSPEQAAAAISRLRRHQPTGS